MKAYFRFMKSEKIIRKSPCIFVPSTLTILIFEF
jgi:hypothetical protein